MRKTVFTAAAVALGIASTTMSINAVSEQKSAQSAAAAPAVLSIRSEQFGFRPEGLVTKDSRTVYFNAKGMPETGWHVIDHSTYYFSDTDYTAFTGKHEIDGENYEFDENGVLVRCWKEEEKAEEEPAEETLTETAETPEAPAEETDAASYTTATTTVETVQPQEEAAVQSATTYDAANVGTAGSLSIPGVGVDVALNYVDMTSASSDPQGVVNAENSAAYMTGFAVPVIADHAHQGFSAIANAYGQTAYIYNGGSVQAYTCVGVYNGTNTGDDIVVNGQSAIYSVLGSLVMYTCQSADGVNVWVTVWNAI